MRLSKLLEDSGITPGSDIIDCEITEIVTDSREVSLGCMFVCLCGGRLDGHEYIEPTVTVYIRNSRPTSARSLGHLDVIPRLEIIAAAEYTDILPLITRSHYLEVSVMINVTAAHTPANVSSYSA